MSIKALFIEGGALGMTLLTIEFILLILAAWKAPAWVKELGLIALISGILYMLLGAHQICYVVAHNQGLSSSVIAGGIKVMLIPSIYGGLIYFVSLVMRIIQKPRI
jgi:hypothetical protein